jgi:virginiamycin B lyase
MRSPSKAVLLGALVTVVLVLAGGPFVSDAATPLGQFTTRATAGETPGFADGSLPRSITTGPDGLMWFVDSESVNRINADGSVTRFDAVPTFGANPSLTEIVTGPDGNLWFTKFNPPGQVGRITPSGDMASMTSFGGGNIQDIAVGPDGNLWYTKPFNGSDPGLLGRITTTGDVDEFTPPNDDAEPRNLTVGADGNIWYGDTGGDPGIGRILRSTPDGTISQVAESGITPGFGPGFFPGQMTLGPDDNVWVVLLAGFDSAVARITPSGAVTEFAVPELALLQDIDAACGALFLSQVAETESTPAVFRLTTEGAFTEYTEGLPDGTSPLGLTQGPDQDLWIAGFGEPGRILTMGAGCTDTPPTTSTTPASSPRVTPRFTG